MYRIAAGLRTRVFGAMVLLSASLTYGADGTGSVFIPNSVTDPSIYSVVLTDLDGSGLLRGDAVDVSNGDPAGGPLVERASSDALAFHYSPDASQEQRIHFSETMTYHYMTSYYRYLRGLGFSEINTQISVTTYAAEYYPTFYLWIPLHSSYHPETRSITLAARSDMRDSDGLDGEVIVHEYAHATQHMLRGGQPGQYVSHQATASDQALSMMEGLADYCAASYFDDPEFAEWLGYDWRKAAFYRNVNNFHRWPDNFRETDVYQTGMIFSGAMWDLRSAVGREVADRLAMRTIQLAPDNEPATQELNTTFEDALGAMLQADVEFYGGAHSDQIRQAFAVHGVGEYDFSSPFPMERDPGNDHDGLRMYTVPGADVLAVTFDEFVTKLDDSSFTKDELPVLGEDEKDTVDRLILLDALDNVIGTFTGRELQGRTVLIPGDTVQLRLITDSYRPPFGYRVVNVQGTILGDSDWDGEVGFLDYIRLKSHYGKTAGMTWTDCDFDFDGDVDGDDFLALKGNFGRMMEGFAAVTPDPSSALLLAGGSALLLAVRRRAAAGGSGS